MSTLLRTKTLSLVSEREFWTSLMKKSGMSVARRGIAVALLACAGGLSACSGGDAGSNSSGGSPQSDSSQVKKEAGREVSAPKDASKVSPCDLLGPQKAESFGMKPEGEERSSVTTGADMCGWTASDSGNVLDVSVFNDRSIQSYVENQDQYSDFEKIDISGYTAVRANELPPEEGGKCDYFVGVNSGQVVAAQANFVDRSKTDPCSAAEGALEEAVSNIPAK